MTVARFELDLTNGAVTFDDETVGYGTDTSARSRMTRRRATPS